MSHLVRSYSKSAGLSLTHVLTSVDVKFISIVSGSLEDSGLFRPANILQIADVVRRIVFLRFLLCFSIVRRETSKMFSRLFHLFVPTTQTTQPRPEVFSVTGSLTCNFAALLTSTVHYGKILPNSSWLWWIMRVTLANQKRRNILNEC